MSNFDVPSTLEKVKYECFVNRADGKICSPESSRWARTSILPILKEYKLSQEARIDLQEIWSYIAAKNVAAADKLETNIYKACELLAKNSRLGHKRPDLTAQPVFFSRCKNKIS